MNSHCDVCDVEKQCGYEYKPCDCCNYRKFKPKEQTEQQLAPVYDFSKFKEVRHWSENT
jgi:hypothetical protein